MEENILETCPFMKGCKQKMTYTSFKSRCNSKTWIYCYDSNVKKYREKIEKTPIEWKLVFELEK